MIQRFYPPSPALALHPYLPEKLGYRRLLRLLQPELARLLATTDPFTLMSRRNRTTLFREASETLRRRVPGCFVEIGVHRGGSAAILAGVLAEHPDRRLHVFDRWGDLPEPTEEDGFRADEYRREAIPEKLAELRDDPPILATRKLIEEIIKFPKDRLHYHAGWYEASLPRYAGGPIAFASLDCDYYESMKLALTFVDRHASAGATIVADDYRGWPGARRAVKEWVATTSRKAVLYPLPTGPAVLRLI